jgi:regulator of nonsense transcripts 1
MMDAIVKLMQDSDECCMFHDTITDRQDGPVEEQAENDVDTTDLEEMGPKLNTSQLLAVKSAEAPLSLIWGPPGLLSSTIHSIPSLTYVLRHWEDNRGYPDSSRAPPKST